MGTVIEFDYLQEIEKRLPPILNRKEELEKLLTNTEILSDSNKTLELTKEYKEITELLNNFEAYKTTKKELAEAQELLRTTTDEELRELAEKEILHLEKRIKELELNILYKLMPKKPEWQGNCIVEIRAAAGGEESALFALDLFRMYTKYIEKKHLNYEILSSRPSDLSGFKEIIFSVEGNEAFRYFRFESGVHRVQRIPITEASGRIHTSTVTVAVLPEPTEIELKIEPQELKIEVFRASGHGGQHVNVTDSAVRITHIPTGIVVSCQDERSQIKNRAKAMKILRARILEAKKKEEEEKIGAQRRSQIGSGDRAEKIRTYNFPQNRVTDHRIGLTVYNLDEILEGDLDYIIKPLEMSEILKFLEIKK
ncbi:MAG: peptide chain release factor 1 [candidate division WOR-3 bacterium]|nr:peptide chain release factor 1 [candidate division WOR-3 bacterium]MCX7757553.1 peptide chain release factor 1 [candidate division WOR-3 bacterium]MDW7987107.1 peptide chain release factor 1 [candidate division WOR-3 bacterium]